MSEAITTDNNVDSVRSISQLLKSKTDDKSFMNLATSPIPKITLNDSTLELDEDQDTYHESRGDDSTIAAQEATVTGPERTCRERLPAKFSLKLAVVTFFFIIVVVIGLSIYYGIPRRITLKVGHGIQIGLDRHTRQLKAVNSKGKDIFIGHIGKDIPSWQLPSDCSEQRGFNASMMCLSWLGHMEVIIHHYADDEEADCFDLSWTTLEGSETSPHDCFDLDPFRWYGGALLHSQRWPMERMRIPRRPFIVGVIDGIDTFGPVLDRYWLTSTGVTIVVAEGSPLHVSINARTEPGSNKLDDQLCFYSDYRDSPYRTKSNDLKYTVCFNRDAKTAHEHVLAEKIANLEQPLPEAGPAEHMYGAPVWSTYAYFKTNISQEKVLRYADDIINAGYNRSVLVIDAGWESAYGDFDFHQERFPNATGMLAELSKKGFIVLLAVHPFVNVDSRYFVESVNNDYLVLDASGEAPGLTEWWHGPPVRRWSSGYGGVIDMTPAGIASLKRRLRSLADKYHIDAFKFDAGEINILPYQPHFHYNTSSPNQYTHDYSKLASEFGNRHTVRAGYQTQKTLSWLHIYGKPSSWRAVYSGLRTIIPTVLTLGIMGYPYTMPNSIGGRAYRRLPSKELYIRWMQMTTFFQTMHFSTPPFAYDEETQRIAIDLMRFHESFVRPRVVALARESAKTLRPIIRPVWWIAPQDPTAQEIDSEFLLGDDVLVAPVLGEGWTARNIYLPFALWQDQITKSTIQGPTWLLNYQAPLDKIPYFIRVKESDYNV